MFWTLIGSLFLGCMSDVKVNDGKSEEPKEASASQVQPPKEKPASKANPQEAWAAAAAQPPTNAALLKPAQLSAQAPAKFNVLFETTQGNFLVEVNRGWSPQGADRVYNLVQAGYYENIAFFRAIKGFMV